MRTPPRIAVLSRNDLTGIGLKSLLEKIIPAAEVDLFDGFEAFAAADPDRYFHCFAAADTVIGHNLFFRERLHKTILLTDGTPQPALSGFHGLNVRQSEEGIVRDILRLHQHAHREGYRGAAEPEASPASEPLSPREIEVLRLVVQGLLNKQIADRLRIALTTVISHRRNIMQKLGLRSVSALTIYAVTKGYVDANRI